MDKTSNHFSDGINNLKAILNQQHVCLLEMLTILRQEHQALSNGNLEQFEDIVQRKHQQVKSLENIQPSLNTVEKMLGGILSKSTFSAFIQRMPGSTDKSSLVTLWKNFQGTLEQCNLQNKTNNRILNASAINTKQALNILHGNTDNFAENVYSKAGVQLDKPQGQSLAIA